ncbi:hypothetical protein R3W88_018305 [Solanum pinnatisectum]|uniref:Uncharacterized protein n=1 Tax=Solanum pinnatisectum TaxID=50273 RepID=A0AAV9L6R9_9SOLN|nr:hypothetical protein R3W88_018305 [Solanum pinnatisectum]
MDDKLEQRNTTFTTELGHESANKKISLFSWSGVGSIFWAAGRDSQLDWAGFEVDGSLLSGISWFRS